MRYLRVLVVLLHFGLSLVASGAEFEPNLGQAGAPYLYLGRAASLRAYIEDRGLELSNASGKVRLSWTGAATGGKWVVQEPTGNTSVYCNGSKPELCRTAIPGYSRVARQNIYPAIDWVLYGREGHLEYDLVLHPGADPAAIRLRVEGQHAQLDSRGVLHAGEFAHWMPEAYQWVDGRRVNVQADLVAAGEGEFRFVLGTYNQSYSLTIDPVIESVSLIGGSGDDVVVGAAAGSSCNVRYGTTRSADWNRQAGSRGRDVFIQFQGYTGTSTVFWGGDGDEEVGGGEINDCSVVIAGWTDSRNAVLVNPQFELHRSRPYAGGPSDGFLLRASSGSLLFATYLGGAGADRLYDARPLGTTQYLAVGETDDPSWSVPVKRVGAGGKRDAIAVMLDSGTVAMLAIGGSGDDRAMRLRPGLVIAGETDSPDFPATAGPRAAAGRDLWIGRLGAAPLETTLLNLYGGSGDESLGGVAVIAGAGLYLAGSTNSTDLPMAQEAFHGGAADGFLCKLDPVTANPQAATYIGGSGRDEITAIEMSSGDLYLGGHTDSPDLALPGLAAGEGAAGGLDALFVYADSSGWPMRGARVGGPADDRVYGVQPGVLGKVSLHGVSESREWLRQFDEFSPQGGGLDGFVLTMSFAAIRPFTTGVPLPLSNLTLGRDLQALVSIEAVTEPGADGLVLIRSGDPSKLLISSSREAQGSGQIILRYSEASSWANYFVLQALGDAGEVEVFLEGRSAAGILTRRRLLVRLAPTALYFVPLSGSKQSITVEPNREFTLDVMQAAILPDGSAGPSNPSRPGIASPPSLLPSDANGLAPVRDSFQSSSQTGTYRFTVRALQEGNYTLSPTSALFPAAPGQSFPVRVGSEQPRIFSNSSIPLIKDHYTMVDFSGLQGDTLRFTSDDPGRILIGYDTLAPSASVLLTFSTGVGQTRQITLHALSGEGVATVRVEGVYRGQPISEELRVQLIPYKVTATVPPSIPAGTQTSFQVALVPLVFLERPPQMYYRRDIGTLAQLRSSNPAVLQVLTTPTALWFGLSGQSAGRAVLEFAPTAPPEFADFRLTVDVSAPQIDFGYSTLRIPAGTVFYFSPVYGKAGATTLSAVLLRLADGAPVVLEHQQQRGKALTMDLSRGASAAINAEDAQPGQQTTLFVSAPGVPEFSIAVRIVEAILEPVSDEVRFRFTRPEETPSLSYRFAGYDNGEVIRYNIPPSVKKGFRARPVATPPGVCQFPESEITGTSVRLQCSRTGTTTVALEPISGLSAAQPRFTVKVISTPEATVPLGFPGRIWIGPGLQAEMWSPGPTGASVTITSSDPERVRLSLNRTAPGGASVTVRAGVTVFVQGVGGQGPVALTAESTDGRKQETTVWVLQSTLVVRPPQSGVSLDNILAFGSIEQPLALKELAVDFLPALVDPATGALVPLTGLSIRGGTDPAFVRAQSSAPDVIATAPPDPILSEGDKTGRLKYRVNAVGEAVLSVAQPAGFVSVPESSLRVRVYERGLKFNVSPLLSADLQVQVSVVPDGGGSYTTTGRFTLTSLDPERLVISASPNVPGQAVLNGTFEQPVYLQALSGVQPGEKVRVRIESPGNAVSEAEIEFVRAELRVEGQSSTDTRVPLRLSPGSLNSLRLAYGPVRQTGELERNSNIGLRPGVEAPIRVTSSDTSVLEVVNSSHLLKAFLDVPLRAVRPGRAELRVEAPPHILNRTAPVDATVDLYSFGSSTSEYPVRYLVTKFEVFNTKSAPVEATITSTGDVPLRFGTAAAGAGSPAATSLKVTLQPSERRGLYLEPGGSGSGFRGQYTIEAPEFQASTTYVYFDEPRLTFLQGSLYAVNLPGSGTSLTLTLTGNSRELPLGSAFGPLRVQLRSSSTSVVRVPATVEFAPGEPRKTIPLELVGAGEAVISATPPAGFSTTATRTDIVLTVK